MALVTLREVLALASENNAAIPAFNIDSLEIAQAVFAAAKAEQYPIIAAVGQAAIRDGKIEFLADAVRRLASQTSLPAVLHLDHGQSLEQVQLALDCGFSSVMIDGSRLPLKENIELTAHTVALAEVHHASVEAELGCILGVEDDVSHDENKPFLVRTEDVAAFNQAVQADALAVGIGNAHGIYKGLPSLDFERLDEVQKISPIPLVLHGGSGIPADMIKKAIQLGIRKINVATEIRMAYTDGLLSAADSKDFYHMSGAGKRMVQQLAEEKIRLFRNR